MNVTRSDVRLLNGRRLSYLEVDSDQGAAKPLMLVLHGKGSSAADALPITQELARDFHVFALDFRGCGFSDWAPDGDYSADATVTDVEQFVAAMQLDRFAIYGASYGAVIGIAYAARNPAHVTLLMLGDGGPVKLPDGSAPVLNPGQNSLAGAPTPQPVALRYASWTEMLASQAARPGPALSRAALESRFVREGDGSVRQRNDIQGLWKSMRGDAFDHPWPLVRRLSMPTLLLRAERGLVPPAVAAAMHTVNPQVHSVDIPGAGHSLYVDRPLEVMAAMREFLRRHASLLN